MKTQTLLLSGLLNILIVPVHAQLLTRESIDTFLGTVGADDHYDAGKGVNWTVLPGPFYTPELKLGLGTAVAGLYRVDPKDKVTQNSSISLTGFISTSGALGIGLNNYTFFSDDQWRLFIEGSVAKIPTEFWGVGYEAAQDSGQKYTQDSFSIHPQVLYRLVNNLYLGAGWDFSTLKANVDDPLPGDTFSRYTHSTSPLSSGATFALNYDSRDAITQPKHGQYASVKYSVFDPSLGSDTHFTAVQLQYNYYFPLNDNDVLAFDAWGRFTRGDVPWDRLSEAGDDRRLRGYYQGRYRDKDVVSTQLEYRKKLNWRHGYVLWFGAGALGSNPHDMGQHPLLPTLGAGYRFEIKPDMNLRLDLGVGRQSAGFYFQVAEAF